MAGRCGLFGTDQWFSRARARENTYLRTMAALPDEALHRGLIHLQAAEFLYEVRRVPERVYTFKNVLTREVVYESLLRT